MILDPSDLVVVNAWLHGLRTRGLAYGADLVMALGGTDNVARAEKILKHMERAGVIERGKNPTLDYRLTRELAFFGVGGASFQNGKSSPLYYGFAPGKVKT